MAARRQSLDVSISLDRILCIDEGDGPGNAEPYLWTLFFKIDGDTVKVDALNLRGTVTVDRRNGEHNNLQYWFTMYDACIFAHFDVKTLC